MGPPQARRHLLSQEPGPWGVEVKVRTGSSREGIGGEHDGAVVIRVAARPVEGKANEAVRKIVARKAGVSASRVSIVRGERSSSKLIAVAEMDAAALRAALLG